MSSVSRNICQNTLFALAKGDEKSLLSPIPKRSLPSWYISCLHDYLDLRIVWITKLIDCKPSIEAHFAGTYKDCLRFTQMNAGMIPPDTCIMEPKLVGVSQCAEQLSHPSSKAEFTVSWPVTNVTQRIMFSGGDVPIGSVQLDTFQERVACASPPLIIESRSGTGKTLVLMQHSAYHAHIADKRPACFVTVSRRLRNELESRYKQVNQAENLQLPDTLFFTLSQLLEDLLQVRNIHDFDQKHRCTYLGYVEERRSYTKIKVEAHLVENEIGGVISGSLVAATQRKPLSRKQYMEDIRSNIGNDFKEERWQRTLVYDEYEEYVNWKQRKEMYDFGDVVMRLLQEDVPQYFSSGRREFR